MTVIRPSAPADLPAITRVRTSVRENHLSVEQMTARGITHETITADMKAGHLGCWVAESGAGVVAFAMADRRNGRLWALFTHPDHEGRGYGSALLARAEAWLKAQGFAEAELDTARHSTAHRFYMKRGWHEISKPGADPLDAYLAKRL